MFGERKEDASQGAPTAMSRRAAVTAAAAVPLSGELSVDAAAADDAVADLIRGAEEKNAAFMRGDMDRWAKSPASRQTSR